MTLDDLERRNRPNRSVISNFFDDTIIANVNVSSRSLKVEMR